jgi:hypothetical protein
MGSATLKTEGGLISAHLTLAGEAIKALYLTGDFFCDEEVVATLERALRWHSPDAEQVAKTLDELSRREGVALPGVPTEAVAKVVALAAGAARRQEQSAVAKGCFVNP